MSPKPIERFLGGPWQKVAVKLLVLSVVVGFLMATFGLDPEILIRHFALSAQRLLNAIFFQGFDAVLTVLHYCFYGAVIVIPIWLVSRLLSARKP